MFISHIDPVIMQLGPITIRYYGVLFLLGVIFTALVSYYLIRKKGVDMKPEEVFELTVWLGFGVIIGARLFYIIVYNFSYYSHNLNKLFAINEGGLSFHGGLIGMILAGYLYCRVYKKDFLELADIVAIPVAIGICFVKLANFINSELVGRISNVSWAFNFNNETDKAGNLVFRHPSQLYEASKNVVIFGIMWILKDKNMKKGSLFSIFLMLYASFRFIVEFFRMPDPQLMWLYQATGFSMGQYLCMIMFCFGLGLYLWVNRK